MNNSFCVQNDLIRNYLHFTGKEIDASLGSLADTAGQYSHVTRQILYHEPQKSPQDGILKQNKVCFSNWVPDGNPRNSLINMGRKGIFTGGGLKGRRVKRPVQLMSQLKNQFRKEKAGFKSSKTQLQSLGKYC